MAYEHLTGKQRLFVDAYIGAANCNAAEAARMAGYNGRANQAGHQVLTNSDIRAAIDERMRELTIPPEEILYRLTDHARANIKDVLDGGRLPERLDDLDRRSSSLIKKWTVRDTKEGTAVSVELHDAQAALLALAKRYDLFPDHTKHSGQVTLDAVLNALPPELREGVGRELAALVRPGGSNGKA